MPQASFNSKIAGYDDIVKILKAWQQSVARKCMQLLILISATRDVICVSTEPNDATMPRSVRSPFYIGCFPHRESPPQAL